MAEDDLSALTASLHRFGLERSRLMTGLARHAGIGRADLDALEHLEADGPLNQRELGGRLLLTSGAVTMLVDRLEAAGLVRRRPHPTDRRALLVELSAKARARMPAEMVDFHQRIAALASRVPRAHRPAVRAFLTGAADAAEAAVEEMRH